MKKKCCNVVSDIWISVCASSYSTVITPFLFVFIGLLLALTENIMKVTTCGVGFKTSRGKCIGMDTKTNMI